MASTWTTLATSPPAASPTLSLASYYGVLDDKIFVFNINTLGVTPYQAYTYNMNTNTWVRLADSPAINAPWQSQCARVGRVFYIMGIVKSAGGPTASPVYDTSLVSYAPDTNTWTQLTGHPTKRSGCGVAAALNLIAMWGGCDGNGTGGGGIATGNGGTAADIDSGFGQSDIEIGLVEVYNPITNTWDSTWSAIPNPVQYPACCSDVLGYVYSIGGMRGSGLPGGNSGVIGDASVQCYRLKMDPAGTKAWERIADLPTPRAWGIASFVHGKIWLYGSRPIKSASVPDGRTFVYTPFTNTWAEVESLTGVSESGQRAKLRWAFGGARSDGVLVLPGDGSGTSPTSAFYITLPPYVPPFRFNPRWDALMAQAMDDPMDTQIETRPVGGM